VNQKNLKCTFKQKKIVATTSTESDACIINGLNGTTYSIPVPEGTTVKYINAGIYNLSCLGSLVWLDNNTNGIIEVRIQIK
jgi:GTPase involved in cell partitioning and DNA repair